MEFLFQQKILDSTEDLSMENIKLLMEIHTIVVGSICTSNTL